MVKVWIVVGIAVIILTVYSLVDCATTTRNRIRGLPRWVWIFVILLVPVVGPLLWLIVGRARRGARLVRSVAPDDDLEFLKGLDRQKTDQERLRALEQELADLDEPDPRTGGVAGVDPKKNDPGEGDLPGRRDA